MYIFTLSKKKKIGSVSPREKSSLPSRENDDSASRACVSRQDGRLHESPGPQGDPFHRYPCQRYGRRSVKTAGVRSGTVLLPVSQRCGRGQKHAFRLRNGSRSGEGEER